MIYFFIAYCIICLFGCKLCFKTEYDYLSRDVTTSVKGIFILMVFFSHFNSYVQYTELLDRIYTIPFSLIGQGMVTMFLFYSGYGVMEQIKRRDNYVSSMPVNRILSTLFQFAIAIVLFALLRFSLSEPFTVKKFVLSLIGWDSLGNSNWYIFAVLCMYVITYISFKVFSGSHKKAAIFNLAATTIYIVVMCYIAHKPSHWYNTALLYPFGMLWSLYRDKLDKPLKNNIVCSLIFVFALLGWLVIGNSYVKHILFALSFLIVTTKVCFGNKVLHWFGKYLFEIYILQRIPMIILERIGILGSHVYLSFIICLSATIVLAIIFKKHSYKIWNYITLK